MLLNGLVNGEQRYIDVVDSRGLTSYVKNGEVVSNNAMIMVLVNDSSDLPVLSDYAPGTIAYTAGFGQMWQKSPAGEWISFE